MRQITGQKLYIGLRELGVSAEMIIKFMNYIKAHREEAALYEECTLRRIHLGEAVITQMAVTDDVRKRTEGTRGES